MRPMTRDHDPIDIGQSISDETVAQTIATHIDELTSAVGSFQDQCEWMADQGDLHHLAVLLDTLREAKAALTAAEQDIAPVIAELMGQQQVQIGDLKLERRGGRKRTQWQSEDLFYTLCRDARFDRETGEELSPEDARQRVIEVLHGCLPLTASLGWRSGVLRSFGYDPDEWAESSPAPWRVEVHRVTDEGVDL